MPWDFVRISVESDEANIATIAANVNHAMVNERIDTLEKKMLENHKSILSAINQAKVAPATVNPSHAATNSQQRLSVATWPQLTLNGNPTALHESIATPGSKRLRGDDGESVERNSSDTAFNYPSTFAGMVANGRHGNENGGNATGAKPKDRRNGGQMVVSGTGPDRKMKAAPADIFVWGVNPDITVDDIIEDLAASEINVNREDVEKKTRIPEDSPNER